MSEKRMFPKYLFLVITGLTIGISLFAQSRIKELFNDNWKFQLGDDSLAFGTKYNDNQWRNLNLPHDWSIEGAFDADAPCKTDGGALPTGIGWYRKTFTVSSIFKNKKVYINFDGVYRNSEVWINGHYLGKRAYGFISFQYDLTPWLYFGRKTNVIAVKVDNSLQPNSRFYTGSGIYRNVWLEVVNPFHIEHWGTFVTTPQITEKNAKVELEVKIRNSVEEKVSANITSIIYDASGKEVASRVTLFFPGKDTIGSLKQEFEITNPHLWSVSDPYRYKIVTQIAVGKKIMDSYSTPLGVRFFNFDSEKGFSLNGKPMKIYGVCMHHDLGALGAAINVRAMERQLQIMREMGCNAIRTSHNPAAPEFLDLCDSMGFLVQEEAFDMWKKKKNQNDYHIDWTQWHVRDLQDMVLRDRNHPCIFMWSSGNEIREQFDSTGITITRELTDIIKNLDTTRPVSNALTENEPEKNFIWQSGALDVLGFNYKHEAYPELPKRFPGQKFIASEIGSAQETRGHYDMPSDSILHWPKTAKDTFNYGNPDFTASAYDQTCAYWGSPHEVAWKYVKRYDFMSGVFVWAGFDYIGEPLPYPWPARSTYFGIVDLCGFPKDVYYMYQSEWTDKPMLHVFPHWNWKPGQTIDVWAYYNQADEVELYINGKSQGIKKKIGEDVHVMWRVTYEPGILKAVSRKNGKIVQSQEIKTAGKPAKIELTADRTVIHADGKDLSFVTVKITDGNGVMVPDAENLVNFKVSGPGFVAGVDNGYQASLEPFKANYRKAYNGMCLVVIQSNGKPGDITLSAASDKLNSAGVVIKAEGN
jgi:beta-galactosidase